MDANTPLWKAHDLSQNLQDKIEVLPNVGRAFVHVDHETTHAPVRSLIRSHYEAVALNDLFFRNIANISDSHIHAYLRNVL